MPDAEPARGLAGPFGLTRPEPGLSALSGLVVLYVIAALVMAPGDYVTLAEMYAHQAQIALGVILLPGLAIASIIARPRAPMKFLTEILRRRGFGALAVTILFTFGMAAFTTFKINFPHLIPFYADPYIARLDALVNGGEPWMFAHAVLPGWAKWPLGFSYGKIWFFYWFGTMTFAAFWLAGRERTRYLWAHALTVLIIGTILAAALSSYGPIFYDQFGSDPTYAGLLAQLDADPVGSIMRSMAVDLYSGYSEGKALLGGGISAMPSVHVAMVTLNAYFVTSLNRKLGIFAWGFVAIILFGSVYYGWHYALDGYVSILVVSAIWMVTGRVFRARDTR